jgi:hypothetical protein
MTELVLLIIPTPLSLYLAQTRHSCHEPQGEWGI